MCRKAAFFLSGIMLLYCVSCGSEQVDSSVPSSSGTASELVLEEYTPPVDGIDYDYSELPLNPDLEWISIRNDCLYEGDTEFRFISMNGPSALDGTEFEQEDLVKTIAQMGGRVLRTYTFSVRGKYQSETLETYITGRDTYNEKALLRLDRLIALCRKYGVRLIIPFIDTYNYNGGIPAFLELYGKSVVNNVDQDNGTFYSDKEVTAGFFRFVKYVLNRKNTITGIPYKDDPVIMAWETGNELKGSGVKYTLWFDKMYDVIRESDKRHLIVDGRFGVRPYALEDPRDYIVSDHLYSHLESVPLEQELRKLAEMTKGKKPLLIGEFGFLTPEEAEVLYDTAIETKIAGIMGWSLRPHSSQGGFIFHQENEQYSAYHWPGLSSKKNNGEIEFLRLTYLKAFEIQNRKPRIIGTPSTPRIIEPLNNPAAWIKWQGSTGAYGYDFQRSESPNGPWTVIGVNVKADKPSQAVMFKDECNPEPGKTYYYRVRAKSIGGFSDWSHAVKGTIPSGTR